jgi:hypothetical protein
LLITLYGRGLTFASKAPDLFDALGAGFKVGLPSHLLVQRDYLPSGLLFYAGVIFLPKPGFLFEPGHSFGKCASQHCTG